MNIAKGKLLSFLAIVSTSFSWSASASDMPRIFMTSVKGNGNLQTWPDALGQTGLQAGDQICRSRAAAASLPDPDRYVAFLSDINNDAYCRVHGASGRVFLNQCNQSTLPTGAGPWFRMDNLPALDVSQNAFVGFPNAGYSPRHILYDEFGAVIPATSWTEKLAFSGTMENGVLINPVDTCNGWTSASGEAALASAYWGHGWTWTNGTTCDREMRLVCMEKGLDGSPLTRHRPPSARMAFVTSVSGSGDFSTWDDADGKTSEAAADAICQKRASMGELPLPQTYKAWISTALNHAIDRLHYDGPLYGVDGVMITSSYAELTNGALHAPLQTNEYGEPQGPYYTWTGTLENGRNSGLNCNSWTVDGQTGGSIGGRYAADSHWTNYSPNGGFGCSENGLAIYCVGDNDSLFLADFDE